MKNLGITKVVRKSKTRIERATKDGAFVVERDEGILIPRPDFLNAWSGLRFCASGELFGGHETKFEDAGESECSEKCVGVVGCELDRLAKRLEAEGLTQAQCLAYAKKNGLVSGEKIGELDAAKILTAFDVVKEFIAREDA